MIEYWKVKFRGDTSRKDLPRGVALWQMFQVMLAERGLSAVTKALKVFPIDDPLGRTKFARDIVKIVAELKQRKVANFGIAKKITG